MKKFIIIGAISFAILGGVGSAYTMLDTLPKMDSYLQRRRSEIVNKEEIINSDAKVNTINLGKLSNYPIVKIKKSNDNRTKVVVSTIYGKNNYISNIKDGVLNLERKNETDSAFSMDYLDTRSGIKDLIFNTDRDFVSKSLDYMVVSGTRINKISMESDDNMRASNILIEVPNSVDINFTENNIKGYETATKVEIEDGLIRDTVKANSNSNYGYIRYNGTINNVILNGRSGNNTFSSVVFLDDFNYDSTKIKNLTLNMNKGFVLNEDVKAENIVINIGNERHKYNIDNIEDLLNKEKKIYEYLGDSNFDLDDETDTSDSDYSDLSSKIKNMDNASDFEKLFKEEIGYAKETVYKNGFDSKKVYEHFNNMFDINIPIIPEMANRLTINAPSGRVRIILEKGFNPDVKIKTKEGIDLRMFLVDKIPSRFIPSKNSVKEINGNIYSYTKHLDKNFGEVKPVLKPEIVVNSNSAYIVDQKIDDND